MLFSHSVMSDSLQPHELQHTRLPCPSPGVCSNLCPSSQWCHPTISSSVSPFSSCPQSFSASGSCLVNRVFTPGGQNIGSFSFSISLFNKNSGWICSRSTKLIVCSSLNTRMSTYLFLPVLLTVESERIYNEFHYTTSASFIHGCMPTL